MPRYSPTQDFWQFLSSWSQELNSKMNRVRQLIGDAHWGEEGKYKEALVRAVLKQVLPDRYCVSTGFVYWWNEGPSRQMDIIVWDSQKSVPLLQEGDFVVVTPEAVSAVVEVKTGLSTSNLLDALALLHRHQFIYWPKGRRPTSFELGAEAYNLQRPPARAIFAFRNDLGVSVGDSVEKTFEIIANFYHAYYHLDAPYALDELEQSRFVNLIDLIAVHPSFFIEQAIASATGDNGTELVPTLRAFETQFNGGDLCLPIFAFRLARLIDESFVKEETSPDEALRRHTPLKKACPTFLQFGQFDREFKVGGRTVEESHCWRADSDLLSQGG